MINQLNGKTLRRAADIKEKIETLEQAIDQIINPPKSRIEQMFEEELALRGHSQLSENSPWLALVKPRSKYPKAMGKTIERKKRQITPSHRAKLAAAQQKRWAEIKREKNQLFPHEATA